MKRFAFLSDFDGTLTSKDFYHIIIDKYLKDWGRDFYNQWKKDRKINVDFLNKIFGSMDLSEADLYSEILKIPFDQSALGFIKEVKLKGGDFYVVSAGTSYYINMLFKYLKLDDIRVISMEGEYINRGIKISPDKSSKYYSEIFGIDKSKVLKEMKNKYKYVFFAGDSEPDLGAAKIADMAFAKGELKNLLEKEKVEYTLFETFHDISQYMDNKRWFSESSAT